MAGLFFLTGVLVYGAYLVAFEADRKYQLVDNLLTILPMIQDTGFSTEDPALRELLRRQGYTDPPYFFVGND